jgi:hypothetical protein
LPRRLRQREEELRAQRQAVVKDHAARRAAWLEQRRQLARQYEDSAAGSEAHRKVLETLGPEPEEPLGAAIMTSGFTFDDLVRSLRSGQPLYGIIGATAEQFIGGGEARPHTIAGLNSLWRGDPVKHVGEKEGAVLYGRRAGMFLTVQPEVMAAALADELLTKQSFLSRVLINASEAGKRAHKATPPQAEQRQQALQRYRDRMSAILRTPYPLAPGTRNTLVPRDVPFSAEATDLFWKFVDAVELRLNSGGNYDSIRPFVAVLPEHAARLGATIAAYRDLGFTELSGEDFRRGQAIAIYYTGERKQLPALGALSAAGIC